MDEFLKNLQKTDPRVVVPEEAKQESKQSDLKEVPTLNVDSKLPKKRERKQTLKKEQKVSSLLKEKSSEQKEGPKQKAKPKILPTVNKELPPSRANESSQCCSISGSSKSSKKEKRSQKDGVADFNWFIRQIGQTDEAIEKEAIQLLELSESAVASGKVSAPVEHPTANPK